MQLDPEQLDLAAELRHADADSKLDFARELVLSFRFTPAIKRELSRLWGLSISELKEMEKTARHQIASSVDKASVRGDIILAVKQLDAIAEGAVAKKRGFMARDGSVISFPDPDYGAAVQAIKSKIGICQILLATPTDASDKYRGKTLEELTALANKSLPEKQEIVTEGETTDETEKVSSAVPNRDARRADDQDVSPRQRGGGEYQNGEEPGESDDEEFEF